MSELTATQLRERLDERKRLNLSESRALIHLLDECAATLHAHYRRAATAPPADLAAVLAEPVPGEIRTAVLDEQRRLYLQAGLLLFERLDTLQAACAQINPPAPATAAPADALLDLPDNLPPSLRDALLKIQQHPDLHNQQTVVGAVYAWCREWLALRADLLDVAHPPDHAPHS